MIERRAYPGDISDARWALIAPTLQAWQQARIGRRPTGEPARTDVREVLNAILYVNRTGIAGKYLPHDFPPHTQPHERPRAAERSHVVASASSGADATNRS